MGLQDAAQHLTAAETGVLRCTRTPLSDVGRTTYGAGTHHGTGVFAQQTILAGSVIERCRAQLLPRWQGGKEFIWSLGAFFVSKHEADAPVNPHIKDADGPEEVLLPFGWGMLYADSSRSGQEPNVVWHVEEEATSQDYLCEQEESDPLDGRPCWLVLKSAATRTSKHILAGEELIVDHRWTEVFFVPQCKDILNTAASQIEAAALGMLCELSCDKFLSITEHEDNILCDGGGIKHPASNNLCSKMSDRHGIGVFASKYIKSGQIVEVSPVVVVHNSNLPSYGTTCGERQHFFCDYTFDNGTDVDEYKCFLVGFGGLYNHSSRPNIRHLWLRPDKENSPELPLCFVFIALRDIRDGEELLHDYGVGYWDARGQYPRDN